MMIPSADAIVLRPTGDGGFVRTRKVRCEQELSVGGDHYVQAGGSLGKLDETGGVQFRYAVPQGERIGDVVHDPVHGRLYVKTGKCLLSVDAKTGQECGRLDFDGTNFSRSLLVKRDGTLLLADGKTLQTLRPDLTEAERRDLPMAPESMSELPDGSLYLLDDDVPGHILILGPDGRPRLDLGEVRLYSPCEDGHGNIWCVTEEVRDKPKVVRYDLSRGEARTYEVPQETSTAVPLDDGSFLAFDDRLTHPRISHYSSDGACARHTTFGDPGHLRHFAMDDRHAYVVVERYFDDSRPSERALYRFELSSPGGLHHRLGVLFAPFAQDDATLLHTSRGQQRSFVPGALADGRIVLLEEEGVRLLSPDGRETGHWGSLEDAEKAVGPLPIVSKSRRLGVHVDPDLAPALEKEDEPEGAPDATIGFSEPVPGADALREIGVGDVQGYERLTRRNELINFALRGEVDLEITDGARATVTRKQIFLEWNDAAGQRRDACYSAPRDDAYVTALPVRIGNRPCLAVGTERGFLSWLDPMGPRDLQSFHAGGPIDTLDLVDGDTIRAVTSDGTVMLFPLSLQPGESATTPQPPPAAPHAEAGRVELEPERVIIAGVAITRQPARA